MECSLECSFRVYTEFNEIKCLYIEHSGSSEIQAPNTLSSETFFLANFMLKGFPQDIYNIQNLHNIKNYY